MKTKRLIIRPLKMADYKKWFDAFVNALPAQDQFDSDPKRPEQCSISFYKTMLSLYRKYKAEGHYYNFGIFENKTGLLVGEVDLDIKKQKANIGYTIYNRYWYQGYGKEAADAVLEYGFHVLKLDRIEAKIGLNNKKSIRMAKAIGMKKQKSLKKHVIYFKALRRN